MADQITQFRIGVPGADGAGVTAAEKNSYFQKTGGTITGQTIFDLDGTPAVQIRKADDTSLVFVDTVNSRFRLVNGMDIQGYSDNMSTETWSIDGATGAAQFDGDITTGGNIVGDKLWWGIEIDGGGSTITTGLKRRIKIPYDCTLVADSVDGHFWQIGLDQSGSIGLDLWMDSYSNYPPTNADRISGTVGSQNPRVSAATKGGSGTTTGWTLNLVGGRYLFVNVDSVSTATFCVLGLHIIRT